MRKALLPRQLKFRSCDDLVRLGGRHDGGYLVSAADVAKSTLLLGLGINTDWRFENDFDAANTVPILAFDPSTEFRLFVKQALQDLSRLKIRRGLARPFDYFSLKRFFSGKNVLNRKFVGMNIGGLHVSLAQVLQGVADTEIFLKMDIEGSEYRCLDDLLAHQRRFAGAVIEFHDVDINIERILRFVESFELELAHIHANNYAPLNEHGLPLAIEVTFSRRGAFSDRAPALPHALDDANAIDRDEIEIGFAGSP